MSSRGKKKSRKSGSTKQGTDQNQGTIEFLTEGYKRACQKIGVAVSQHIIHSITGVANGLSVDTDATAVYDPTTSLRVQGSENNAVGPGDVRALIWGLSGFQDGESKCATPTSTISEINLHFTQGRGVSPFA